MSNVEQMQDNLSYMKDFNGLTEKEQETLKKVFDVSILELFAEDGVDAISTVVYPETPYDRVSWKGDLSVELFEIDA